MKRNPTENIPDLPKQTRPSSIFSAESEITTFEQALTKTLALAICAPTEAKFKKAVRLADWFAARLSPMQITRAKRKAIPMARTLDAMFAGNG